MLTNNCHCKINVFVIIMTLMAISLIILKHNVLLEYGMTDLFDYILFYLASVLLAVCKFGGFIDWSWIWIAAPTIFAFIVHGVSMLISD